MVNQKNANDNAIKPVVLVDGSSYLFRAYYALPELTTSAGKPTGAVRGVIGMIRKLANDYAGSTLAVVFDAPGKTFRDDLYSEYKANRESMPDDLREQIPAIHEIIRAMGLPLIMISGVEADDVIGTLAAQATAAARETVISTGDKDMAQLVTEHVTLVNTMTETTMDREGVVDKFGVPPERIIDYLALMGDSVDNIPGVPKVGPKTAAKWLNQFGTLDDVIERAEEIKGKVGDNLRDSLEQLPLSRELTTIKCDVELEIGLEDLAAAPPDNEKLRELYTDLDFKAWIEETGDGAVATVEAQAPAEVDYTTITDLAELDQWVREIESAGQFALATKTDKRGYMDAAIVGFALAIAPGRAAYVPVGHGYAGAPDQIARDDAIARLKPLLESAAVAKVGQNLKFDKSVLARHGIELRGELADTMLESYVLNSVASRHHLQALASHYLERTVTEYEDIAGKGAKQLGFEDVPVDAASSFAAEEADVAFQLHAALTPRLAAEGRLQSVFEDIEMPLMEVLSVVERNGALVDGRLLRQMSAELGDRLESLRAQAYELAGEEFNVDSTKQLQEILYDKLGLPVLKKTPGGKPSTAEPVLVDLARDYELPATILDYRGLAKLKSTYTNKLPLEINEETGRIHTSYQQAVAATGRLSSADPNLQNIPIRNAEGRRIRQAFVPPPGKKIVAADYSQIELRIMAHLSGDENLLSAFADNADIHRATAAEVFGQTLDEVSDDERRSAKAINFGLIYGMSAFGLGRQLGISRTLAQEYIDRYFTRYPGVRAYMDETRASGHDNGFVETVFGRRLYLPEINARHAQRRQAAERTAINAPMQGTAADIIKRAMIEVQKWLEQGSMDALMIMQVHDELVFEVAEAEVAALVSEVSAMMQGAADLAVPLIVDAGVGDNWDEAH